MEVGEPEDRFLVKERDEQVSGRHERSRNTRVTSFPLSNGGG